MNWFQRNFKSIIYTAFLVPILTVAFVSISHVTMWYGISNPISWAIYLSIGIEIAALSALAAISANMGRKVYFPFGMVTLIQFIGNIYFAYQYIDMDSESFKNWVGLVDPIVSFMGVEQGDFQGHKRFLAFFAGGMLPLISLSFLHMLVKFEEEEKKKSQKAEVITPDIIKPEPQVIEVKEEPKPIIEEIVKEEEIIEPKEVETNEKVEEEPVAISFESLFGVEDYLEQPTQEQKIDPIEETPKRKTLTYTK